MLKNCIKIHPSRVKTVETCNAHRGLRPKENITLGFSRNKSNLTGSLYLQSGDEAEEEFPSTSNSAKRKAAPSAPSSEGYEEKLVRIVT